MRKLKAELAIVCVLLALCMGALCWTGYQLYLEQAGREKAEGANLLLEERLEQQAMEIASLREELDEQLARQDALVDAQKEEEAAQGALALENAQLREEIAAYKNPLFVGKQMGIQITLPEDVQAAEMADGIYIAFPDGVVQGLIREVTNQEGQKLTAEEGRLEYVAEHLLGKLGYQAKDWPEMQRVELEGGQGLRFAAEIAGEDGKSTRDEILIMMGKEHIYCLELEAERRHSQLASRWMDAMAEAIVLP